MESAQGVTEKGQPHGVASSGQTPPPLPWLETLRSVIAAVEASDANEVEVRTAEIRIAIHRVRGAVAEEEPTDSLESELGDLHTVRAPMTGVWYDAPSPGAAPFLRVGDAVSVGAVVGLLEAMKVFNEVHSDAAGIVKQMLVHRGELVMAHAPLLTLEPAVMTLEGVVG